MFFLLILLTLLRKPPGISMNDALISFLKKYRPIPEADAQLILAAFKPKQFKEGDSLFNGDGICRELFFVCDGILRIIKPMEDGRQFTYFFISEGRFCSILNSFNNQVPATEMIQAATNAEVLAISHQKLTELYRQIPYLQELITQITHQGLLDKINTRNAYVGLDATEQYKLFLKQQPEVATRVSVGDMASYLGVTPQSLSRIRKNLH